jgi:hypothetical protein
LPDLARSTTTQGSHADNMLRNFGQMLRKSVSATVRNFFEYFVAFKPSLPEKFYFSSVINDSDQLFLRMRAETAMNWVTRGEFNIVPIRARSVFGKQLLQNHFFNFLFLLYVSSFLTEGQVPDSTANKIIKANFGHNEICLIDGLNRPYGSSTGSTAHQDNTSVAPADNSTFAITGTPFRSVIDLSEIFHVYWRGHSADLCLSTEQSASNYFVAGWYLMAKSQENFLFLAKKLIHRVQCGPCAVSVMKGSCLFMQTHRHRLEQTLGEYLLAMQLYTFLLEQTPSASLEYWQPLPHTLLSAINRVGIESLDTRADIFRRARGEL